MNRMTVVVIVGPVMVRESFWGRVALKVAANSKRGVSWCGGVWGKQGAGRCPLVAVAFAGVKSGSP